MEAANMMDPETELACLDDHLRNMEEALLAEADNQRSHEKNMKHCLCSSAEPVVGHTEPGSMNDSKEEPLGNT